MSRKCDLCDGLEWLPVRHCDCVHRLVGSAQFADPDPRCQVCFGEGSLPVPWGSPGQRVRRCVCKRGAQSSVGDVKAYAAGDRA